jgi:hypothetical protein
MHAHDLAMANNYSPGKRKMTVISGFLSVLVPGLLGLFVGVVGLVFPLITLASIGLIAYLVNHDLKIFYNKNGIANPARIVNSSLASLMIMFVAELFLAGGLFISVITVEGESSNPFAPFVLPLYLIAVPLIALAVSPIINLWERPALQEALDSKSLMRDIPPVNFVPETPRVKPETFNESPETSSSEPPKPQEVVQEHENEPPN